MIYLLPHIIARSAQRYPEREAFRCGAKSLTYSDLYLTMNQLSQQLLLLGVKKGDRIGVYMERCIETSIAIFGIMNAGAAYVPLDPFAPASRTRFVIKDCGIKILVTNSNRNRGLQQLFQEETGLETLIGTEGDFPVNCISWRQVVEMSDSAPTGLNISEKDLAYILYTSGSTGVPKGIMYSHYSGLSYAKLSADLYKLSHLDRLGNHAPIYFDISTFGYFSGPLVGACTVIIPDAHLKMPASLAQLMEKEQLTVWYSVPLALIQLLEKGVLEGKNLGSLRWILYAGEAFPIKHLCALMEKLKDTRFSNVYGPTELNQCTYYKMGVPPVGETSVPIGRVWGNTEMLIVDEDDQEVPFGESGELLVRSATMMIGYWGREDLTEQSFYKRSIVPGLPEVFYRTGDIVRQDEHGRLDLLGRKDRQIKTRGFRVELDEVTAVLLQHAAVKEAAVYAIKENDVVDIEAVVILQEGAAADTKDLQKHLGQQLPSYAVPHKIIITETLPRTATGKINIKQLQEQAIKS